MDNKINIEDVKKVEVKIGKILSAEKVPETDKLLKLTVDFGEASPRQIISGIAFHFPDLSVLVGTSTTFITNLEPRNIKGLESNGMLFAVGEVGTENFSILIPQKEITPGSGAR
jgi:methionine--tRNA ligase beta chain